MHMMLLRGLQRQVVMLVSRQWRARSSLARKPTRLDPTCTVWLVKVNCDTRLQHGILIAEVSPCDRRSLNSPDRQKAYAYQQVLKLSPRGDADLTGKVDRFTVSMSGQPRVRVLLTDFLSSSLQQIKLRGVPAVHLLLQVTAS